jgi:plasmid stabilization system protein ParE
MANYGFHPDALIEYAEATTYYVRERSPSVAEAFEAAVESAIKLIVVTPDRWRVVEEPGIRRYVFRRFPYVLYYRWDSEEKFVTIFAVMHCSREPGYWKRRLA